MSKLVSCPALRAAVERGLTLRWSPQQIAARLVVDYPDDPQMRVSHETIYQSLLVHSRGALRRELVQALRMGRAHRQPRRPSPSRVQVYFCDPHSPWRRGSNENVNELLRQYFPKGTDLSTHSAAYLDAVAAELNGRPRQPSAVVPHIIRV